eukprot:11369574-Alexandrium_andersonii.AAC.1
MSVAVPTATSTTAANSGGPKISSNHGPSALHDPLQGADQVVVVSPSMVRRGSLSRSLRAVPLPTRPKLPRWV